jgi:addiction module RelE/StbE family toxin
VIEIIVSKIFRKYYSSRILSSLKLTNRFTERVKMFSRNPAHPVLCDHSLQGQMKSYRAFSITNDIRIVYQIIDDQAVKFVDIGTHDQVYKK